MAYFPHMSQFRTVHAWNLACVFIDLVPGSIVASDLHSLKVTYSTHSLSLLRYQFLPPFRVATVIINVAGDLNYTW